MREAEREKGKKSVTLIWRLACEEAGAVVR